MEWAETRYSAHKKDGFSGDKSSRLPRKARTDAFKKTIRADIHHYCKSW